MGTIWKTITWNLAWLPQSMPRLFGMAAYVSAESLGIHGVMIGAVRNKPEDIAGILGLPDRVYAVFGMCLGFPTETPKQKPRMPVTGIVHHERYKCGCRAWRD